MVIRAFHAGYRKANNWPIEYLLPSLSAEYLLLILLLFDVFRRKFAYWTQTSKSPATGSQKKSVRPYDAFSGLDI